MENTQPNDFLTDYERNAQLEEASQGKRFANYIVDLICFYAFVFMGGAALGIIIYYFNPDSTFLQDDDSNPLNGLINRILGLLLYGLFMSVVEGLFKGRTLGKLITSTVAVKQDGSPITWTGAFRRGFSRAVPFEPFSALGGNPWHDRWTDTKVVVLKK
jgi:uncharacterized RDD family membrane protein YckC